MSGTQRTISRSLAFQDRNRIGVAFAAALAVEAAGLLFLVHLAERPALTLPPPIAVTTVHLIPATAPSKALVAQMPKPPPLSPLAPPVPVVAMPVLPVRVKIPHPALRHAKLIHHVPVGPRIPVPTSSPTAVTLPSSPAPPPTNTAASASAVERYAALVRESVQRDLQIPPMVMMMNLHGWTGLALDIAPNGVLDDVSIVRPSGATSIDRAALAAVRATRFPPFSGIMPHHPIVFSLKVRLRGG
jgi:protein TonB